MNKVETVINEIRKIDRFKGHIIFFMMNKYGFVFGKDVEKLKKIEVQELEYEEGMLQNVPALRFRVFDPNNLQPFNSILITKERPASVIVQPEYCVENEFIKI